MKEVTYLCILKNNFLKKLSDLKSKLFNSYKKNNFTCA